METLSFQICMTNAYYRSIQTYSCLQSKNVKIKTYKTIILHVVLNRCELHNEKTHTLCPSPSIIRMINSRRTKWIGHVPRMGAEMHAYRILVGNPRGRIPLGRPRRRWKDNIKMDHRQGGVVWTIFIWLG
jgi:hypothetical protein